MTTTLYALTTVLVVACLTKEFNNMSFSNSKILLHRIRPHTTPERAAEIYESIVDRLQVTATLTADEREWLVHQLNCLVAAYGSENLPTTHAGSGLRMDPATMPKVVPSR
jgi:hypothetical protein